MVTDSLVEYDNKKYYLGEDGVMAADQWVSCYYTFGERFFV